MLSRTLYPWRHLDELRHLRQEEIVKRDMNLALAILKTLEENKSPHLSEFDIEATLKDAFDVSNRGVGYQLNLLADANLVRSMGSDWRLTWDGHEFLKSAAPNTFEDT
jgi:repressor of nif and glnA expression